VVPLAFGLPCCGASSSLHRASVRDRAGNTTTATVHVTVFNNTGGGGPASSLITVGPGYVDPTTRQVIRTTGINVPLLLVVTEGGLKTIQGRLVGLGYRPAFEGSLKQIRDTERGEAFYTPPTRSRRDEVAVSASPVPNGITFEGSLGSATAAVS